MFTDFYTTAIQLWIVSDCVYNILENLRGEANGQCRSAVHL